MGMARRWGNAKTSICERKRKWYAEKVIECERAIERGMEQREGR